MNKHLEELKKDFDEMTEKLDLGGYNPLSPEVQKIINIGMLYLVYEKLKKAHEEKLNDDYEHAKEELMDAERYIELYDETKDPSLKTIASQECQHSHYWLNKIRLMNKNKEEQTKYNSLLTWYNSLIDRVNK